ncbi:MAG TPA: serine hydrolase [Chitinophagaceae bacterium]|nr:serine hydrolase [Chitinophagaceae bacterium]
MNTSHRFYIFLLFLLVACKTPSKINMPQSIETRSDSLIHVSGVTHSDLANLLRKYPERFQPVLTNPDHKVQVIYTKIDRRRNGKPVFTDHYFNINDSAYFYPASTVKLPVAILALQKLNELKIRGLDNHATMITEAAYSGQTEVYNDPSTPDGRPTIEHYIKKILLVSDNDAFNRLYEFLGQEYINNTLHKMGYEDVQIIHRLEISLTEEENRHTNPVHFFAAPSPGRLPSKDATTNLVYEKPLQQSRLLYAQRNTKMGKGFYRRGELVNEPFDFSMKNRMSLTTLHNIVRAVMFPEAVPKKQRFRLTKKDYDFLRKYMSMTPSESRFPFYDKNNYWDNYVKFLFYGSEKDNSKTGIRIFNKVGDAYGFLTDAMYFADFNNNVEFMLSAVIHCNSDEIFNDDKYEYDTIGFPFMKNLGQVIYEHELNRTKQKLPDLGKFKFDY